MYSFMPQNLSYRQYLKATGKADDRSSWIDWKMYLGMEYTQALKASIDKVWGYTPLEKEEVEIDEEINN